MNIESSILNLSINGADLSASAPSTGAAEEGGDDTLFRNILDDVENGENGETELTGHETGTADDPGLVLP